MPPVPQDEESRGRALGDQHRHRRAEEQLPGHRDIGGDRAGPTNGCPQQVIGTGTGPHLTHGHQCGRIDRPPKRFDPHHVQWAPSGGRLGGGPVDRVTVVLGLDGHDDALPTRHDAPPEVASSAGQVLPAWRKVS
jgi:hypothetical protein